MRTGTSWGVVCLERGWPTSWFFETLKSEHDDGRETVWRYVKAHERMLRGSTKQRPCRGDPEGAPNAMRGSASSNRVTPACLVRISWMRKPLKSGLGDETSWPTWNPTIQNGTKGRSRRETYPATEEGNPLKAKTQGRYRHEIRLERLRAESKRQEAEKA